MHRDGRRLLFVVALAVVAGLWLGRARRDSSSVLGAESAPFAGPGAPLPAGTAQERGATSDTTTPFDGRLDSPFCPAPGETQIIQYRHTLESWLRRVEPADDDVAALLQRYRRGEGPSLLRAVDRLLERPRSETAAAQAWAIRARLLRAEGRTEGVAEALRQAFRAAPTVPALAIEAGLALRHTQHLDDAIRALTAYQQIEPQASLQRTIALLEVDRDLRSGFGTLEFDGSVVQFTDDGFDAVRARRLGEELSRALDDAARLTGTPRRTLTVVVYPAREELFAATCVRSWTAAVYDGSLRLVVARGTSTGLDLSSLRHEALHAQAIPFAPDAPRWFHEGLADLFAGDGVHARPLWARLVANRTWIPMASLEGSLGAIEASDEAQLAYAQSLAMVSKLRDDAGDAGIRAALTAFKSGKKTAEVLRELRLELDGEPLLAWMSRQTTAR